MDQTTDLLQKITKKRIGKILNDPEKTAKAINLIYVADCDPGITRKKTGNSFSYYLEDKKIEDEDILYFEYSKFSNISKIDKGGFGEVCSADYTSTKFALKRFFNGNSKVEGKDINKLDELVKEVSLHTIHYHCI